MTGLEQSSRGRQWRRGPSEPMFATALSLMVSTVVTNGLGLAFWVLAAHLYSPAEVGRDVALVSLMIELSTLGQLDLAAIVVRFLPAVGDRRRFVAASYAVAMVTTAAIATAVVLVAASVSDNLAFLTERHALGAALVVSSSLWSVFAIQDGVLVGLGAARYVPLENAAFGVLKLASLGLLGVLGVRNGAFVAFALPMALLLVPVNLLLFRRVIPRSQPPTPEAVAGAAFGRRRLLAFVVQDYVGSLLAAAALTALPLLVVALLGSASNAFFYLPLLIVLAVDMLFANACTSLVAAGSHEVARQTELARLMTRRAGQLLVPAALALVALTPWVLAVFGADYVENASTMMRLLAVASIPRAAHSLYAALARFRGDGRAILTRQLLSVATLGAGVVVLAPRMGLTGVGVAWLVSSVLVALTSVPGLFRALR